MRDIARTERWAEERAAARAAEPEATAVIEGRIAITGEVLTVKFQDNDYGGAMKMLIRDDRGFKLWGTRPRSLDGDYDPNDRQRWIPGAEKGDRVTFTATIERSGDDETFGFFKRPTKASIIERGENDEEEE